MPGAANISAPLWMRLKESGATAADILRYFGVRTPPVDVEKIAERMGLTIVRIREPGWSGALESSVSGRAIIWLDQTESIVRQRFTVAHEIGHLMLDEMGKQFRDSSFGGSSVEVRANRFAADLLVPLELLSPYAYRRVPVTDLAALFNVSVPMMDIRLGKWAGK